MGIGAVTFSRWKKERPELYTRIKKSFECEAVLKKLEMALEEAIAAIRDEEKQESKK